MTQPPSRALFNLFLIDDKGSYKYHSSALVPFLPDYEQKTVAAVLVAFDEKRLSESYLEDPDSLTLKCAVRNQDGGKVWARIPPPYWGAIVTPQDEINIFIGQPTVAGDELVATMQPEAQDGKAPTLTAKFVAISDSDGQDVFLLPLPLSYENVRQAALQRFGRGPLDLDDIALMASIKDAMGRAEWAVIEENFYNYALETHSEDIYHLRVKPTG